MSGMNISLNHGGFKTTYVSNIFTVIFDKKRNFNKLQISVETEQNRLKSCTFENNCKAALQVVNYRDNAYLTPFLKDDNAFLGTKTVFNLYLN